MLNEHRVWVLVAAWAVLVSSWLGLIGLALAQGQVAVLLWVAANALVRAAIRWYARG